MLLPTRKILIYLWWEMENYRSTSCHQKKKRTLSYFVRVSEYHCASDLLFDLFGFSCLAYADIVTCLLFWFNPNRSNRMSVLQWYFPIRSKSVCCLVKVYLEQWRCHNMKEVSLAAELDKVEALTRCLAGSSAQLKIKRSQLVFVLLYSSPISLTMIRL